MFLMILAKMFEEKTLRKKTKKKIKHIRHVFIVPFNPKAQKHICKSILKYKLHLLNNKT